MKLEDAVSASPRQASGTLATIQSGDLRILRVEPADADLEQVLSLLEQQHQPTIIVLPEQGSLFAQAEDFSRVKQLSSAPPLSFVIPSSRLSSVARYAYEQRFHFSSSLEKAEGRLRDQVNHSPSHALEAIDGRDERQDEPSLQGEQVLRPEEYYEVIDVAPAAPSSHPMTPLPEALVSPRRPRKRVTLARGKWRPLFGITIVLVAISAVLLSSLLTQPDSPLVMMPQADPRNQLTFTNSGQLDPTSTTGLNDIVSLNLQGVSPLASGMSYYAWLLPDKTQDTISPILLGKLQPVNGRAQLSYQDRKHTNLLATYSRFLVTVQRDALSPSAPTLDSKSWRFQGAIPDIPTPGDEQGFSLLSHMRHLLAKDPTLSALHLSGGLDIWLYRNASKIFEWSNAARDDWKDGNTDVLLRQVDRIIQYLDGEAYAWHDLPSGTPWLVDPNAGRIGLVDVAGSTQELPSFLTHVRLHLAGMIDAPGHTEAQVALARKIDTALAQVEVTLHQVRSDASQLAKMKESELKSPRALSLLNDMQTNASSAYIGTAAASGSVPGIVWIHTALQGLANMPISMLSAVGQ